MIEEAHEAHFGGALRIGAFIARPADHQRARRPGNAVGAERQLVEQPRRHGAAIAHAQIDVEHLGLDLARRCDQRRQQRCAVARHDVAELEAARADLGEVMAEPIGQRGVDIDQIARRIDREEPGRRVVEIFDGVLQFLEHVFLALAIARDVGKRPDREFRIVLGGAERPHPHPQPAPGGAIGTGDPHLLGMALGLARGLEQPEHRLRHVGIADEHPLNRPHILRAGGAGQAQIGLVGIDDMAAGIGDRETIESVFGHRPHDRIVGDPVGEAHDPGRECEQHEQPDHRQERQRADDIGLGMSAAERHERQRRRHDRAGDQQHQGNAAAAPRRLRCGLRLAGTTL